MREQPPKTIQSGDERDTPKLLRLQRSWDFFLTAEGWELGSTMHFKRFRLGGRSNEIRDLLHQLRVGVPVDRAESLLAKSSGVDRTKVRQILHVLEEAGGLVTTSNPDFYDSDLLDRQTLFFELFETSEVSGWSLNQRLKESAVIIVGLGGYGSWLALLCAQLGIQTIVAFDDDRIEVSNLPRQFLYRGSNVGQLKVEACASALQDINPSVRFQPVARKIEHPRDLYPYIEEVDLVFNAFGYARNTALETIARACGEAGVPSLLFGGSWIGPLSIPTKTACYWCLSKEHELLDVAHAVQFGEAKAARGAGPAFAPRLGMTACVAAWEATRFLSGIDRPPTLDGIIVLDSFEYSPPMSLKAFPRNGGCHACRDWTKSRLRPYQAAWVG